MQIAAARLQKAQPKRVLIVDDIKEIRKLLREFLQEAAFVVCGEAANGQAAKQATAHRPDIIILDASMPVMTGIQAAPRLRTLLPGTAIILFTAHEFMMQGVKPRELGVDAVVNKDRGMDALGECLASLAGRNNGYEYGFRLIPPGIRLLYVPLTSEVDTDRAILLRRDAREDCSLFLESLKLDKERGVRDDSSDREIRGPS